jgi:hypothetical protein
VTWGEAQLTANRTIRALNVIFATDMFASIRIREINRGDEYCILLKS